MTDIDKFLIEDLSSTPVDIVCYNANTIPKYLIILDNSNLTRTKCYNLLHIIIEKEPNMNTNFKKFYELLQKNSDTIIDIELALHIWYYQYRKVYNTNTKDYINTMMGMFNNSYDEAENTYIETKIKPLLEKEGLENDLIMKLLENKNKISIEIKEFKERYFQEYQDFQKFKSQEYYGFDNENNIDKILIQDNLFLTYVLNDSTVSLDMIFNSIELDDFIPFSTYNNYIKVLKEFDIEEQDWLKTNFNSMKLETIKSECQSRGIDNKGARPYLISKLIDYENNNKQLVNYNKDVITLKCTDETKKNYDTVTISLRNSRIVMNIKTKENKKNKLLDRIYKVIKTNKFTEDEKDRKFSGKLFIIRKDKDISINQYIFAACLMNENNIFFINEFVNASTNTKTIKLQYDYNPEVQTSIQNNVIYGNEKFKLLQNYEKRRKYLQINILSCKNKDELRSYINNFNRILNIYYNNLQYYTEYYEYYNSIVGKTFNLNEFDAQYKEINDSFISNIIDDISGIKGWARKCQETKNKNLQIYDIKHKNNLSSIDTKILLEKLDKNFLDKLTDEDYKKLSEYFFKDEKDYIYMKWPKEGDEQYLFACNKKNEGESSQFIYPGIMSNKGNSAKLPCCFTKLNNTNTVSYYTGIEDKKENQNYTLTTESLLSIDARGDIINPKIHYIVGKNAKRLGVDKSNYSFLSCIWTLRNIPSRGRVTQKPNTEKIKLELEKIQEICLNCSLQSNYDINLEQIKKNINSNQYFDPRLYTLLLETYYKINIITFNKEGDIISSRNKQGDLFFKYNKTYFIYENIGDKQNICEAILVDPKEVIKDAISYKYKFYMNNKKIKPFIKSKLFNNIQSQYLDPYGKCRLISINYKNSKLHAYTFLPALNNAIMKEENTNENDIKLLAKFIEEMGLVVISQYVIGDTLLEIHCEDDFNNKFYFKVVANELDVKKTSVPYIINYESSNYEKYIKNNKRANILKQNLLWAFSQYNQSMEDFLKNIDNYFVDIPNYLYPIDVKLDFNNGYFKDKKLIIGSNNPTTLRIRLIQYLRLFSIRFINLLNNYKNRKIVSNTYDNISDFTIYPKQYLVYYNNTISKDNNNISIHYQINEKIYNNPYLIFFKNKLFLAQDCSNLETSLYISINWHLNNFNYKYCDKQKYPKNYNLYDPQGKILNSGNTNNYNIIKVNDKKFISILKF